MFRQAAVCAQLRSFAEATCRDVVFRRSLRYHPKETLASAGFEAERVPDQLGVRHYEVAANITEPVLFGPAAPTGRAIKDWPLELRLVRYGLKPMALVHAHAKDAWRWLRECDEHSLCAILSPFAFEAFEDSSAGGYVNIAQKPRPATAELEGWRGLLVARDTRQIQLGWLSLLFRWDEFLGMLLGYPDCCVRAYRQNWSDACASFHGEIGAVLLSHESQARVDAAHCCMNLFARYFGFHLTEHFPCGFGCRATAQLGDRLLNGLRHYELEYAGRLGAMLAAPVLYAGREGTYLFPDGTWANDGQGFRYSRILASMPESPLAQRLASARTLPGTVEFGRLMRFPAAA